MTRAWMLLVLAALVVGAVGAAGPLRGASSGFVFTGAYRGTCVHTLQHAVYSTGFVIFPTTRQGVLFYSGSQNGTVGGCSYSFSAAGGVPDAMNATLTEDVDWKWNCEPTIELLLLPNPDGHGAHLYLNDGAEQFAECDCSKVVEPSANATAHSAIVRSKRGESEVVHPLVTGPPPSPPPPPGITGVYGGELDTTIQGDACQLPFEIFFTSGSLSSDGSVAVFWMWGFCGERELSCAYVSPNVAQGAAAHAFVSQLAYLFGSSASACPSALAANISVDDSGTVMQLTASFEESGATVAAAGAGTVQVQGYF